MMGSKECKVLKLEEFSCPGKGGFSFRYPLFEGWGLKAVEKKDEDSYVIWLEWPEDIEFEVPPGFFITRIGGDVILSDSFKKNPQGVMYDFTHDLSHYVDDYVPKKGVWDYLEFYANKFFIRISRFSCEEHGFDGDAFYKEVIGSFRFVD